MITNWIVTGDTHGSIGRFKRYNKEFQKDEYSAVIILGDAAFNWTLTESDACLKDFIHKNYKFRIYCVRGNHEARPQDVPGMELVYDEDVNGEVYIQKEWPNIRYFKDWGIYTIGGLRAAVVGGAYSVDKWYRLEHGSIWFENEQLSGEEKTACLNEFKGEKVDIVFTHTCPLSWEPSDLFLCGINQFRVDKSMEIFLDELARNFSWKVWCFGHYHADRLERPGVEQYFTNTESLKNIWDRWQEYRKTDGKFIPWWLTKSPLFYTNDELVERNR